MAEKKQFTLTDYEALGEFRYQIRRFVRFSEEAARAAGVEPQHHQLMLALKGAGEGEAPHIGHLAERLQIQHHSAVELVDRLVRKGLVTRTRSEEDRREVHVQLTASGERILEQLTFHTRAELRSAAPTLVKILRKLTTQAKAHNGTRPKPRAGRARKD
jgi:DNA-binding MarR family transcriptional regulator